MAITSDGFYGTVTLVDNGLNTSTLHYDLNSADFTEASADMAAIIADLDPVTDAVIKGWRVGERLSEKALALPGTGVQVENIASMSCLINGTVDKYATIKIPAPVSGIFVGSSGKPANVVDPTDVDLIAYLEHFETTGEAQVSDGEYIAGTGSANVSGKRIHRGSRKG